MFVVVMVIGEIAAGVGSTFQHSQRSKPSELTIYGNAITRVLLAAANEGANVGRSGRLEAGSRRIFSSD
jgi:hypothetical protein